MKKNYRTTRSASNDDSQSESHGNVAGDDGMCEIDDDVDMNTSVASDAPPWTQSTVDSVSSDPTSEDRQCFLYWNQKKHSKNTTHLAEHVANN